MQIPLPKSCSNVLQLVKNNNTQTLKFYLHSVEVADVVNSVEGVPVSTSKVLAVIVLSIPVIFSPGKILAGVVVSNCVVLSAN
jgi:hypothetical protein